MNNATATETLLNNLIAESIDERATELAGSVLSARNQQVAMRALADYLCTQYDVRAKTSDGELGYRQMQQYRTWISGPGLRRDCGATQWQADLAVLAGPGSIDWQLASRDAARYMDQWSR